MVHNRTNASLVERGFHYQDMVGLIVFIDNIEQVTKINVEGKDDIDLFLINNKEYYYQAKETINPYRSNMSGMFEEALKTLNEDAKSKRMDRIIYVSNSTHPLGDAKNSTQFYPSYSLYNYEDLEPILKTKVSAKIKKLDINNFKENLDKFYVLKISYEGADDRTKLREFNDRIDVLVNNMGLNPHKRDLANEWQQMIMRSTEEEERTVTKEEFYSHTVVTAMFSRKVDSKDFNDFLDIFDVSAENESYIREQYEELVDGLYDDFEMINKIETEYNNFLKTGANMPRTKRLKKFVEKYESTLSEDIGRTKKKDSDVVKFLIWITIKTKNIADEIRDVINL